MYWKVCVYDINTFTQHSSISWRNNEKKNCHFFPKFGHFEYIMRYVSKIFGKKLFFSFQNFRFKSPIWNCAARAWSSAQHNKNWCATLKKANFRYLGTVLNWHAIHHWKAWIPAVLLVLNYYFKSNVCKDFFFKSKKKSNKCFKMAVTDASAGVRGHDLYQNNRWNSGFPTVYGMSCADVRNLTKFSHF
jgi:hypothetical protein